MVRYHISEIELAAFRPMNLQRISLLLLSVVAMCALADFSVSAAPPPPDSDLAFIAGFRCPESYTNDANRQNSYAGFMSWIMAHHPKWTLNDLLIFRYGLLELHDCTVTLDNIRRSDHQAPASYQSVAETLLPPSPYTSDCIKPETRHLTAADQAGIDAIQSLRDKAETNQSALSNLETQAAAGDHIAEYYLGTLYDPSDSPKTMTIQKSWKLANAWYMYESRYCRHP